MIYTEELSQEIVDALGITGGITFLILLLAFICITALIENKKNIIHKEYIKTLNEHDRAVIYSYLRETAFTIKKKDKK